MQEFTTTSGFKSMDFSFVVLRKIACNEKVLLLCRVNKKVTMFSGLWNNDYA